ncbi:N-acetyl-1-D-myo-inositol-2-amino-2-deoxy-alpha-D-glucopyranoside deacetylase [Streptomyces litchfieldiae]|uniref:1D-myo-inositol 2-acetamido-2-deoxy-alpha-D-glucopyranoside deacetylase n=1 Tax=Streptomyces litchfieldiae TaxID=3075543 RepID=A0ABU2MLM0_9ACTN|nr:N-acetyl-1-D-myo-inositol-2-amino-2-deoxy-alpha-D-glucopyranoside deacetylase [Streptomyces sp. DSM 44938]MDT0342506.1 N-acetyl-1-D-myo-inositol-2-amino-2-deoxy-alpha-D-glucopyranoside deacetylase [Streptomyces sp. DSM 44938]
MSSGQAGVLLVHAHPDDESINNGVTMAACVAAGARVTLVTCTLGEEGEVIPPALAHLAAGREDALGPHRAGELAAAMRALGVTDHRLLGGPGRWRDSGMMGLASNDRPNAFWRADLDEAGAALAEIIAEVRPSVLITYDENGGYGHPDHIQAHRVALRGAQLAAGRHEIARLLVNCVPRSVAEDRLARLAAAGPGPFPGVATVSDVPGVTADELVTLAVRGDPARVAAKTAAMAAHATQIEVGDGVFALSNGLAQPLWETEYYRLIGGAPLPAGAEGIFAGLAADPGQEGDNA